MPSPDHVRLLREKIGHAPLLLPGVTALVFNDANEVLLGRRADTGHWAVVGGIVDPGELPADAAVREVREETGVVAEVERVSGVYGTSPMSYPNGDVASYVIIAFRCRAVAGVPRVNDDESLEVRYFALHDLPEELSPEHQLRVLHAAEQGKHAAFFGVTEEPLGQENS